MRAMWPIGLLLSVTFWPVFVYKSVQEMFTYLHSTLKLMPKRAWSLYIFGPHVYKTAEHLPWNILMQKSLLIIVKGSNVHPPPNYCTERTCKNCGLFHCKTKRTSLRRISSPDSVNLYPCFLSFDDSFLPSHSKFDLKFKPN